MVDVLLSSTTRSLCSVLATIALAAFATGCGGKGAEGACPALDECGGDPTGNWQITEACQYAPVRPGQPTDVNDYMGTPPIAPTLAPPQPQPTQLAPSTSGDWCFSLDYNMDTVNNVSLWHDAPVLQPGSTISFTSTPATATSPVVNNYTAIYSFATNFPGARNTSHFAPICLTANGGDPSCDDLTAGLTKFYAAGNGTPQPPATFTNIKCLLSASDGGCDCTYLYQLLVVDTGTWSATGGTISEESSNFTYNGQVSKLGSPAQTVELTYCQQSGTPPTLQLSGANGEGISDLPGLRTMLLQKM
jgi:hypothetical protein